MVDHAVLGELRPGSGSTGALESSVEVRGATIQLALDLEGIDKNIVLDLAADFVSRIDDFVLIASKFAADQLLDTYNENWRHYSMSDGKGGFVDTTGPSLTAEEFSNKLKLSSVRICGDSCCEIWFSDNGMFAGHSVYVRSFDGTKFKDVDANLFG